MTELRYNPLLRDWVMVASNRQDRPYRPTSGCPFCPGSGRVPDEYDVLAYPNDFPALSENPPSPDDVATSLYETAPATGRCEVILYSSEHRATLATLTVPHIRKVIDLWAERFADLERDPQHKYILIFENRGPEVGVTMPHPHGQLYAYPYVPLKIKTELASCEHHHEQTGHCLICDIRREEEGYGGRMVLQTQHFSAFIPFFTHYPYGLFVVSRAHKTAITDFGPAERDDLAKVLRDVTRGMDSMFGREFPYMMVLHQRPVDESNVESSYHFHIEFYPPLWDANRVKYLASSETGAWAPCNPAAVEVTAPNLRAAVERTRGEKNDD